MMRPLSMALVATMMTAGAANAAGYSVFDTVSGQIPFVGSLSLAKFDTSLGTLNSATYTWSFSVTSNGTITNNNTTLPVTFIVELIGSGQIFEPSSAFTPAFLIGSDGDTETFTDLAPLASDTFSLSTGDSGGGTVDTTAANGPGSFTISYSLTGLTGVSEGANFVLETATVGSVSTRIVYDYTPTPPPTNEVPLPAALPLFAAALGGLALVRRRKN